MENKLNIWVDIDNAPHVLVLYPLIIKLQGLGHTVCITARDYGQVIPLLNLYGLEFRLIGRHAGKNKTKKVLFFFFRSLQLILYALNRRFDLAFCHGSRGLFIPAKLLNIPLVVLSDYEYTALPGFLGNWATMMMVPEVIPDNVIKDRGLKLELFCKYPGIKEDLYVFDSQPNPAILKDLGISSSKVIVLVRPPATMAHYHVQKSEQFFYMVLDYLIEKRGIHVILSPRTDLQKEDLIHYLENKSADNITILTKVYRGPELIQVADIVISGGGTMNREAACLGVPVYSIYAGPLGAVDRYLMTSGRLGSVRDYKDLEKISFVKTPSNSIVRKNSNTEKLLDFIIKALLSVTRLSAEKI